MKAWQFTAIDEPLHMVDLADPEPGPTDIIVDTRAVGLCHSDIGFMNGTITALLGHVPIVLGHEIVGTVSAVGTDVTEFVKGDRVGIPATTDGPGTALNGGYAQKSRSLPICRSNCPRASRSAMPRQLPAPAERHTGQCIPLGRSNPE